LAEELQFIGIQHQWLFVYLAQVKLKHARGDVINYITSKQLFIESNNGDEHFFENIENEPTLLHVVAASAVGLHTTINK